MNKTIWIVLGVVVIAVAAWLLVGKKPASKVNDNSQTAGTQQEQSTNASAQMSLKDLVASGKPQQCDFTDNEASSTVQGTVYVGNGKMRGDFAAETQGKTTNTHMIMVDQTNYVWVEGQGTGYKMSADATAKGQTQSQTQEQAVDQDKKMDYHCQNWSGDDSEFNLPSGVSFSDMSSMMQGMASSSMPGMQGSAGAGASASVKAQQCAACNNVPGAGKAQCLAALSCP